MKVMKRVALAKARGGASLFVASLVGAVVFPASVASAAVWTPQSYVQDGLVTHFDGIDNAKTGTHDSSTNVWKDLVGGASLTLTPGAFWGGAYLNCGTNMQTINNATLVNTFSATVEAAVNVDNIGRGGSSTTVWPFLVTSLGLAFHGAGDSSHTFRFFVNGADPRPDAANIYDNTLSGTSDGTRYRIYRDGLFAASVSAAGSGKSNSSTWNFCHPNGGTVNAWIYSFRVYNRALTDAEVLQNARVDRFRFYAWHFTGTGAAVDWSAASWLDTQYQASATVPPTTTNAHAAVVNATLNVAVADNPALASLSLADGAVLNVAEGAVVSVKELYVEGVKVARGIYTGADSLAWVTGAGVVRVAGDMDRTIPSIIPTAAADGWYEFGDTSGRVGVAAGYMSSGSSYHYMKAERPTWDEYAFPVGAKLRLKGYILLDTVPANTFSEVDFSQLTYLMLHSSLAFADNTPVEINSGANFRYQPGTWTSYTGLWWITSAPDLSQAGNYKCDANIKMNGGTFRVFGDGISFAYPVFTGNISGTGTYYSNNFGKQSRFTGGFAFDCSNDGFQNGTVLWLDTLTVTARLQTVTLASCLGSFSTNSSWCANGILFGKDNVRTPADHELYIKTLTGNASSTTDPNNKRWRTGGHLFVWGSNTVHVGELKSGIHAVTHAGEFDVRQSYFSTGRQGVGPAYLVVDKFSSGTLYTTTNVFLTLGTMEASTTVDYTYQSGNINDTTLDLTNTCASSAIVKATDLHMLPARLSGFAGKVQMTDTAAKTYTVPVDLTQGASGLYQTAGCIGSGVLDAAPSTGTIDATFPTTQDAKPVPGEYALARFTSGGGLLADWTVKLNGVETSFVNIAGMSVQVQKDATGLWLKVTKTGFMMMLL